MVKRSDGRYMDAITDPRTGKRKYFYGKTQREVLQKILLYTSDAEEEKEKGIPFKELTNLWWDDAEERLSPTTARDYLRVKKAADEFFKDDRVKEITTKRVTDFLRSVARRGVSSKTVRNYKGVITVIMSFAVAEGYIDTNPAREAKAVAQKKSQKRCGASADDVKRIIDHRDHPFPVGYIAIMTGMRKGEILGLKRGDIDFERNIIHVNRSVYYASGVTGTKEPKTEAGARSIPIVPAFREWLWDRYGDYDEDDYIVSEKKRSKPMLGSLYGRRWDKYCADIGIACTAHQLRHSFVAILSQYLDPSSLMRIVGHSDIRVTANVYDEMTDKKLSAAAEVMEKAF